MVEPRESIREDVEALQEGVVLKEQLEDIEGIVALVDELADQSLKGGVLQRLGLKVLVGKARRKTSRGSSS
ncbi:MAG: hypothetical protein P8N09_00675 [Planctomycetota bacterium]|nr:hypothetical protein [Planctomycetota bacterium]